MFYRGTREPMASPGGPVYLPAVRSAVLLLALTAACGSNRGAGGPRSVAARDRMVLIPAGAFLAGATEGTRSDAAGSLPPLPRRAIDLPAFRIDRVPVTEREYARFLAETAPGRPREGDVPGSLARRDASRGVATERYRAHPAVLVAWGDAAAYCAWRDARLPREEEWEKAMRGTDGRAYPWGDAPDATRLNSLELGAGDTVPVLSHPRAVSPFDVHDGAGNAAEWTATAGADALHYVVRGSAWDEPAAAARVTRRRQLARDTRSATVTFRCATSP